jgi:hypothetical protein
MEYRDLSHAERVILPDAVKSSVSRPAAANRRPLESSDDYPHVVVMLECQDASYRCGYSVDYSKVKAGWALRLGRPVLLPIKGRATDVCAETDCTRIAGAARLVSRKRSRSQRRQARPPGWGLESGSHISRFNIHTTLTCTVKSFFCHQTTPIFGYTNGLKRNGE